jgi:nucleoside-diphosphate-sugar epimerase
MTQIHHVIVGCGDVGRRLAKQIDKPAAVTAFVRSDASKAQCQDLAEQVHRFDLDAGLDLAEYQILAGCFLSYLVAPQKSGVTDQRSNVFLKALDQAKIKLKKIVLISTTGVYGDCAGEWVDETSSTQPQTDRGKRRLSMEQQWQAWASQNKVPLLIYRVPGIYANSRLPRERIAKAIPVVRADECGYTNRIHADDLANAINVGFESSIKQGVFNITDGTPGKISEYLQEAAKVLDLPALPEISMQEAQSQLSDGMLSYLSESRKISNQKMLQKLGVELRYPDFKLGLKY